jgi:glycerol-3-phosphate acyltransferase PlsY
MKEIIVLFFSYLFGSIPFGFIFTKIFAKQNILEIGWRKTSGSNVFKNVGFLPGVLTGVCDLLKGSLSVFLAKKLSLPIEIQSLCGFLAVVGHNWSIFLKFAGGRGVGTFVGSLLILDPKIFLYSLFPTLFFVLLLDSSIATLFFLAMVIFLSLEKKILIFAILSFFAILFKRLSPIGELSLKKQKLIFSRLIFDDEIFHQMRIKKILSKLTKR